MSTGSLDGNMAWQHATGDRDLIGYGHRPPHPRWPDDARLAVQFVLNYEEGAERNVMDGDSECETALSEIVGMPPVIGRCYSTESIYEYGSRVGVWRLLRLFAEREIPLTVFAVGLALERNPEVAAAFAETHAEVASHGYRWIDYRNVDEATEREHIRRSIKAITGLTGQRPLGWYTGRVSSNTRRLVIEEGGFLYDSDSYADEIPYWDHTHGRPHLIIPYTFDANDQRFAGYQGFNNGEQFFVYLKDTFDLLYREGAEMPRMMSVGLHCRLVGRPGRAAALARFLDYAGSHERVWFCRRIDIARHWRDQHPPDTQKTSGEET
jgi:putative urate catabolism protein